MITREDLNTVEALMSAMGEKHSHAGALPQPLSILVGSSTSGFKTIQFDSLQDFMHFAQRELGFENYIRVKAGLPLKQETT